MASPKPPLIPQPVSIVIPVRNGVAFLRRAVASSLQQDAREIIVVDNLSTDETPALVRELAERHPTVIGTACPVPGASAARNHGLRLATGEWVQFLDADDALDAGKVGHQLARAPASAAWIISGYRNVYDGGAPVDNLPHPDPWRGLVFRYRIGCTCANLYRRKTLLDTGGWNEALPNLQDPDLHFRLLRSGAPYFVDAAVRCTYYHRAAGQITKTDVRGGCLRRLDLLFAVNGHLTAQRPEYWRMHRDFFRGALLRAARVLATHDLGAAAGALEGTEERWTAWGPPELISPLRWRLYRSLGFRRTEALRLRLAGLLPAALKSRLK